jgi:hypothetical protein
MNQAQGSTASTARQGPIAAAQEHFWLGQRFLAPGACCRCALACGTAPRAQQHAPPHTAHRKRRHSRLPPLPARASLCVSCPRPVLLAASVYAGCVAAAELTQGMSLAHPWQPDSRSARGRATFCAAQRIAEPSHCGHQRGDPAPAPVVGIAAVATTAAAAAPPWRPSSLAAAAAAATSAAAADGCSLLAAGWQHRTCIMAAAAGSFRARGEWCCCLRQHRPQRRLQRRGRRRSR